MKVTIPFEYGQSIYMKDDPDQTSCTVIGFVLEPNKNLKLRLSYMGDIYEVYDFEVSKSPSDLKRLDINLDEEDE